MLDNPLEFYAILWALFVLAFLIVGLRASASATIPDDIIWRRCNKILPARLVTGEWYLGEAGQVWRRRQNGRWEYRKDDQSYDDWCDQQI